VVCKDQSSCSWGTDGPTACSRYVFWFDSNGRPKPTPVDAATTATIDATGHTRLEEFGRLATRTA
jgi:hypothetical protein